MPKNLKITLDIFGVEPYDADPTQEPLDVESLEFWDLIADDISKAIEQALNRSFWIKNYKDIDLS